MDLQALEYTRSHYDRHAQQFANTKDALKARATGPSAPLKAFHNTIKRKLINRFAHGAEALLDFACGRGGDIWKWIDADIRYVKGLDLSPGEIAEARQRYLEARSKRPNVITECEFDDTPNLGIKEWRELRQYNVVTCMFAVHYFFVSEAALLRFMKNVADNLVDGGYFIGTVPDGKRINECVYRGHNGVYDSPLLRVEARWQGSPATFGSAYVCAIGDTVTGGEKGTEGSLEYLVYSNVLVGVAAQVGLKPVLLYHDQDLESCFEKADANKPLKHFDPHFPGSDPSLEKASRLFTAFAFQKTSGSVAMPSAAPSMAAPASASPAGGTKRPRPSVQSDSAAAQDVDAAGPTQQRAKHEHAAVDAPAGASGMMDNSTATAKPKAPTFKRPPPKRKVSVAPETETAAAAAAAAGGGNPPILDARYK